MSGEFEDHYGQTYTPREILFCEKYLTNPNAAWAWREAGYSPKGAYSNSSALLKQPKIKMYMEKKREELGRSVMGLEELLETLTRIALGPGAEAVFRFREDEDEAIEDASNGLNLTPDGRLTVEAAIRQAGKGKRGSKPKFDLGKAFEDGTADLISSVKFDSNGQPQVTFESRMNALRILAQYYGLSNLSTPEAANILLERGFMKKE